MRKVFLIFALVFGISGLITSANADGGGCNFTTDVSGSKDRAYKICPSTDLGNPMCSTKAMGLICKTNYCKAGDKYIAVPKAGKTSQVPTGKKCTSKGWSDDDDVSQIDFCEESPLKTDVVISHAAGVTYTITNKLIVDTFKSSDFIAYSYTGDVKDFICKSRKCMTGYKADNNGTTCVSSRNTEEGKACAQFNIKVTRWDDKSQKCICVDTTKDFRKDEKGKWGCYAKEITPPAVKPVITSPSAKIESFKCSPQDIALLQKWAEKYVDNDMIIHRIGELLAGCNGKNLDQARFDTLWAALSTMVDEAERAKISGVRDISRNRIKESTSRLDNWIDDFKANTTVWKDEKGKFNATRLLSDTAAAVVLGTTGGLVTSKVMKKNQIKKGFENVHCTVGGQIVANWGDEFQVGVHQNN